MLDGKAFGEEVVEIVRGYMDRTVAPLLARVEALESRAATPGPQGEPGPAGPSGESVDQDFVARILGDAVERAVARIPPPKDGEPGPRGEQGEKGEPGPPGDAPEPAVLESLVSLAVATKMAELPVPKDGEAGPQGEPGQPGRDADPELVATLVAEEVERRMVEIPAGKDGDPGPQGEPGPQGDAGPQGEPGPAGDVDMEALAEVVDEVVQRKVDALPKAKDGEPGPPGRGIDWLDVVDGHLVVKWSDDDENSQDLGQIAGPRGERGETGAKGDPGERGKDGVGVAGAMIDRSGNLLLTCSDGTVRELGMIVGKDGAPGRDGSDGAPGTNGKDGADGRDGFGFDDLDFEHDGERGFKFKFVKGEQVKEFAFEVPVVVDQGVYKAGTRYRSGDGATWAGSYWICQRDEPGKPGEADSGWRLAVKAGRPGKDGKDGAPGPAGPQGRPGKDLTQLGPDGAKW